MLTFITFNTAFKTELWVWLMFTKVRMQIMDLLAALFNSQIFFLVYIWCIMCSIFLKCSIFRILPSFRILAVFRDSSKSFPTVLL